MLPRSTYVPFPPKESLQKASGPPCASAGVTTIAEVAAKAADTNSVASIFGRSPREETRNEATAAPRARTPTVYFVENANPAAAPAASDSHAGPAPWACSQARVARKHASRNGVASGW